MRRLGMVMVGLLVVVGGIWLGLMWHFPGEAASRYVSAQVSRAMGFDLVLTPATLRWNRMEVERAELRRRDLPQDPPLFILTDFAIPLTWKLFQGLPVQAVIGREGRAEAFLPWGVGDEAWLEGQVVLEEIPLPAVLKPLRLQGRLQITGRFTMDAPARQGRTLPTGILEGRLPELTVDGVQVGTMKLPTTRLEGVRFSVSTGRVVQLKHFEFKGDIQGNASGSISPNMKIPRSTLLDISVNAAFRNSWLTRLGDLKPLVEGFLERGRLMVKLNGTVANPRLRTTAMSRRSPVATPRRNTRTGSRQPTPKGGKP